MEDYDGRLEPPEEKVDENLDSYSRCDHSAACARVLELYAFAFPRTDANRSRALSCAACHEWTSDEPTCLQLTVSDGMTGHAVCSRCHGAIDPWDAYCRHCGAKVTNRWRAEQ